MLPTQFQYTDPLPALGRKIVPQAPKKPDPIAAFEEGVHLLSGEVLPSPQQRQRERTSMAGAPARGAAAKVAEREHARALTHAAIDRAEGEFDLVIDLNSVLEFLSIDPRRMDTAEYNRVTGFVNALINATPQAQRDRAMEKVMVTDLTRAVEGTVVSGCVTRGWTITSTTPKALNEKLRLNLDWLKGTPQAAPFSGDFTFEESTPLKPLPALYALSVRKPV